MYAESYYRHTVTIGGITYGPGSACRGDQIRTLSYFGPPATTQGLEVEARLRVFAPGADSDPRGVVQTLYFYGSTRFRPNDPAPLPDLADEIDYENFGNRSDDSIGATTFNNFPVGSGGDDDGVTHISHSATVAGFNRRNWHWAKVQWMPRFNASGQPLVVNGKQQCIVRWLVSTSTAATAPAASAYTEVHSTFNAAPDDSMRVQLHNWIPGSDFSSAYSSSLAIAQNANPYNATTNPQGNRRFFFDCDNLVVRNVAAPVDKIAPKVSFTNPLFETGVTYRYRSGLQATGLASDTGGSGLQSVKVRLMRLDGQWWHGDVSGVSQWKSEPAEVPATLDSQGRWSLNLPASMAQDSGLVYYRIRAVARDGAGNAGATNENDCDSPPNRSPRLATDYPQTFGIQNVFAPLVVLTTPTNAATVYFLSSIAGTVEDTDIDLTQGSVQFRLRRESDGYYWNGTAFTTAISNRPATLSATSNPDVFNWQHAGSLPATANLTDGATYTVTAIATDASNKTSSDAASFLFLADTTPPTVSIVNPANNAFLRNWGSNIRAGASDAQSKPNQVHVFLYRLNSSTMQNEYWSSGAWTPASTPLYIINCNGINGSWPVPVAYNPPAPADGSQDGLYHVKAISFDRAGNASSEIVHNVTLDTVLPDVAIVTPSNGITRPTIGPISGTAEDKGSGLSLVQVRLSRRVGTGTPVVYEYWNGTSWGSAVHSFTRTPPTPFGIFGWNMDNVPLPPNDPDDYYVRALAYDRAGNANSTVTHLVTVGGGSGLQAGSPQEGDTNSSSSDTEAGDGEEPVGETTLSSAAAHVSSSTLTLQWSAPLDTNWACDLSAYVVWVNGEFVTPQGAIYNIATNQLTVLLPLQSLNAGDEVSVAWFWLQDSAGHAITNGSWQSIAD